MTASTPALQSKANCQQLEAILATDGPLLVIAGPGSGKTFTLVERIVHLITQKGGAPESLLVITFTDKAARGLTTRISNLLAELGIQFNLNEMYLGTFYSICLRLLEDYPEFTRLKRSFTLFDQFDHFDQFDQQYFLYQHITNFRELPNAQRVIGDDHMGRWTKSENLLKWLNKVGEALDATKLAAASELEIRALAVCFAKHQELLHEHNSLDSSGIQYEALQLPEKRPAVLTHAVHSYYPDFVFQRGEQDGSVKYVDRRSEGQQPDRGCREAGQEGLRPTDRSGQGNGIPHSQVIRCGQATAVRTLGYC
ncbi:UvrD-helicase domain-containing protein [Noviherbaspirillum suwonense]|uniref:DNA 3'-5' helicase II n=1 Tax=Noviherbaspirillum suwonense TaxID=1224511 RepID=A0ABY1Q4H3_9BURK|nr:ATP-dependent helicase [Noviherbaspirillum suwonense]SMP59353.1 UvrD/REP helicase N-terminal domain-containing protein [Noviherbaspirillum suwonense]